MAQSVSDSDPTGVVEIDVFTIGPHGELLPIDASDGRGADDESLDGRDEGKGVLGRLSELRAQPGHRLGLVVDRVRRRGDYEEVVQPVAVLPGAARAVVIAGELFAEPIRSLDVDTASRTFEGDSITWRVSVRTGVFSRRRTAALCLHPTPSANLSVIELIPSKRRWFYTGRFVAAGVVAVDVVGSRLQRLAADAQRLPETSDRRAALSAGN